MRKDKAKQKAATARELEELFEQLMLEEFLHLGEDEHVNRLQEMLEIIALKHEHDPRVSVVPQETEAVNGD